MRGDSTTIGPDDLRADPWNYNTEELPILTSKLTVPDLPDGLVVRPQLHELLDNGVDGVDGSVTLVCAPAGWGKTALLSSWVRLGNPPYPVAWLTLEKDDAGDRFWAYVCIALRAAIGDGAIDEHAFSVSHPGHDDGYLHWLAAGIAQLPGPVVLVLDDFQQISDPDVLGGLRLLQRHAGRRFRLVLATRVDPDLPLSRWRLSGELTELRTPELALRPGETAELLARHDVRLPSAHTRTLHSRTEGWPAGARLAALSLRERTDPASYVCRFAGNDRAISDYLSGEVCTGLPADVRNVLRRTSIVQRVCGRLIDALSGRTDGGRILADLERDNAFLVPLAERRSWYRFHQLFGDMLRAELWQQEPDIVPDLHRRAAAWHAANGLAVDALHHALAARDWRFAKGLLVTRWPEMVLSAHGEPPHTAITPPPADTVRADPELALAYAADRLNCDDLMAADTYLQLADRHGKELAANRGRQFTIMAAAFRLAAAQLNGVASDVPEIAQRLLDLARSRGPASVADEGADESADEGADAIALAALGSAHLRAGDLCAAEDTLREGLAAADRAGLPCPRLTCSGRLAMVWALSGRLRLADDAARSALGLPLCHGRRHAGHGAHAHLARAIVCYQRGRTAEAERYVDMAADSGGRELEPEVALIAAIVRAGLLQARGEPVAGREVLLDGRRALGEWRPPGYLEQWATLAEAAMRTAYGDTETARKLLENAAGDPAPLAVALARTHVADDDPYAAALALAHWTDGQVGELPNPQRLEAGFAEALAAHGTGDPHRAARALEHVLELAEPEGFRRVFTSGGRHGRDLLIEHLDSGTAFWSTVTELVDSVTDRSAEAQRQRAGAALAESLTTRELTVLRYLRSTLSNAEIAAELCLSVNTVKTHAQNIYRKLDTGRRREAVRRARDLHLL